MNDNYFSQSSEKTWTFYFALGLLLILEILSINTDLAHFASDENVPHNFFYLLFGLDFLVVASILLIFFYKKAGIFLLPIAAMTHYILHEYYLSTTLYSDLNLLFVFISAGLLVIIPRWKFFK